MPRTVEIVIKARDQASRALRDIGNNTNGLTSTLMRVGMLGVPAVAGLGVAVGKLAYDAAQTEPVRIAFENLSESIGETGESMLEQLRPATLGVMSDLDLMKATNKLMAMGLADSAEEAAKLTNMAVTLGSAMGVDAASAIENFTLMLANQSIPRLDTFGISSGTVRERINELLDSVEGLTREQAFLIAVQEQGEIAMEDVGDITDTAAVRMAAFKTKVTNAKDELGTALIPILETLLDEAIGPLVEILADDLIPIMAERLPGAIEGTLQAFRSLAELIQGILDKIEALDKWTSEHLAPPEMRGYMGRAAVSGYTQSYMGPSEGGRWGQRVQINVHGVPGAAEYIRGAIESEGVHVAGTTTGI